MKKVFSYIIAAGLAVLGVVSCAKKEMVIFDPASGTAPVLTSYTMDDDGVYAEYTPGSFKMGFNEKVAPVHSLALLKAGDKVLSKTLVSKAAEGKLTVTRTELCKALMTLGFAENDKVNISLAVRASLQDQAKDNGLNGYIDSENTVDIQDYEIWLPTGDPYARYTEPSPWSLVGSFNGWGSDPDVAMLTNGALHLAKAVTLAAGDEVKFRKDNSWDVNFGYAEGVTSYTLGEDIDLSQGGANIKIVEDGVYDFILDADGAKAKIIQSVALQEDPYAAYTEVSPWSVIGSFNSWGGDEEMVTNGTLHVAKNITLAAGDEFKLRKDANWDVNFGYADGVETYTLGEAFAAKQGGANIKILEDGAYDIILDPEAATIKIIKTQAVTIDPYAAYTEVSTWSVIGSFNSWADDVEMVTNGTLHVAKAVPFNAGDEWKFRKDADWKENFGYADGVESYTLGEEFAMKQDGGNIKIAEDGVYDLILDPANGTGKIIKSIAVDAGDTPAPKPKPKSISLVGTLDAEGAWNTDHDLTNTSGDTWVVKNVTLTADDEFKLRADHDWGTAWGGPEANEKSTIDPENPYDVYAPTLGTAFNTGDKNIRVGVAGAYNITFTYGDTPTILIEEYKEFPDHVYMTGADFGNWFGDLTGVVELTPVLHNPAWGANAEGQFWTVRYFKAGSGFKFNSAPSWDGNDFNSLETNDGFTVSDGNCFVPSDGFYMVHIDFKRSILHIEPAKVRIVGDCTGLGTDSWNVEMVEAATNNVFVADGTTLKVTLPAGGNLRMYAASAISTSDPWTREFNIYDGKIVYRGTGGDLDNVPALAEQVVTLDFNAGTGSITGEGQAPAYKDVISVPGNWSEWTADAPKLGGDTKGLYKGVLAMYGDAIEFKFIHDGSWIGGTAGDGLTYTLGANDNMTIAAGTYFWTVDLVNNTASAVAVNKVGLMGTFNGWADDKEVFLTEQADHTYTGSVTLAADDSLKVRLNSNWDLALGGALDALSGVGGDIKVATAGTYQVKLDFNARTLTLIPANN
ncbi:MAG TPA: hypothetical protein DCF48_01205 [Rikenellaceae bacterium]|nr:hypothetical protein [Rikenellaceae bacterium]